MPVPRPTDPEAAKLDRELARRMWGGVALRLAFGLVGILLIFGIAAAVKAVAAPFTPGLNYAYELSNEHWGGATTHCLSIDFEIVPDGSLPEGHEAEATIPDLDEPPVPCVMFIERKLARPAMFARACAVVRHEDGHLHGEEHVSDPHDIMYEGGVTYTPSQCWTALTYVINHPLRFGRRRL